MANREHLRILKRGVGAWNRWRKHQRVRVVSSGGTKTHVLPSADLSCAELIGGSLESINLSNVNLQDADLRKAQLWCARFLDSNLRGANLSGAELVDADFSGAYLVGADLTNADLTCANFEMACLDDANLTGADLSNANLGDAYLRGADFSRAHIWRTVIADADLSEAKGLNTVIHDGPSTIGIDTLYKSLGKIPDKFLRDAGVPEDVIEHLLPLIRTGPVIRWHSCFISYSTKDAEFARRLHGRMREAGLRVWFATEDLKGGRKQHEQLFEAIQLYDKLLLVLSEHSIKSEWVMTEIRKARQVERKEQRRKLFPIRLVDFDTLRDWTCFDADNGKDLAVEVREYFIPDFSNWKNHDAFERSFARLLRDLKASESKKA